MGMIQIDLQHPFQALNLILLSLADITIPALIMVGAVWLVYKSGAKSTPGRKGKK